eukprot:CAMPEP_0170429700 /NCGR_PEP_ID=MMETSP0117_2-20130122/40452_1 /TAXON_ID=400756 /ORGANISM="Durinskia baltica, Strain CSIRO CS-38" /LENGTH=104 /DNA_ID=CAMNT_0010689095 /DNA_START=66 /DNA_END=380 /DNA_ORIENTATION=+
MPEDAAAAAVGGAECYRNLHNKEPRRPPSFGDGVGTLQTPSPAKPLMGLAGSMVSCGNPKSPPPTPSIELSPFGRSAAKGSSASFLAGSLGVGGPADKGSPGFA